MPRMPTRAVLSFNFWMSSSLPDIHSPPRSRFCRRLRARVFTLLCNGCMTRPGWQLSASEQAQLLKVALGRLFLRSTGGAVAAEALARLLQQLREPGEIREQGRLQGGLVQRGGGVEHGDHEAIP